MYLFQYTFILLPLFTPIIRAQAPADLSITCNDAESSQLPLDVFNGIYKTFCEKAEVYSAELETAWLVDDVGNYIMNLERRNIGHEIRTDNTWTGSRARLAFLPKGERNTRWKCAITCAEAFKALSDGKCKCCWFIAVVLV